MSAFEEGKLCIKCSLDLLRRAVINIMPKWEKHIKVDPLGGLVATAWGGNIIDKKFELVVAGPKENCLGAPGNNGADIGMRKTPDGFWEIWADRSAIEGIRDLEEEIKGELLRMRVRAYAKAREGTVILREVNNEDEVSLTMAISKDAAKSILKAARQ